MRISDVIPAFKRYALFERGMTPKTIREIIAITKALSNNTLSQQVKYVTTTNIRDFLYKRKQERLWTNKTFRNYRQYLKSFFDYCLREGFIKVNPINRIEKPKLPKQLPRSLNKRQVNVLLMNVDCHNWYNELEAKRNQTIIRTFLLTGMRLNELLKLKTTSINFAESEIIVYQGKGGKDRIIPIHPRLFPYLKSYHSMKKKKPSAFFFSSIRSDRPLTQNNLYAVFKKLKRACGFNFTPHQLRHTFGKLSTEANLNIFKLQQIMGHSSVSTTQIYVSISNENLKKSFQKTVLL